MDLVSSACAAIEHGDFKQFDLALHKQRLPDAFRILQSARLATLIRSQCSGTGIADWIMTPITWNVDAYDPRRTFTRGETLMHLLWQDLNHRLTLKLDAAFQRVTFPPQGAILCFFHGTGLNVIVAYRRTTGGAVSLRPIAAQEEPRGVFELSHFLSGTQEQRNSIKAAALSVDKLLFQRGALVHVDRQREDVFGPSIDTVLLAEILAQWIEDLPENELIDALEVGPGNGLLSVLLASAENTRRLYAVDVNPVAVTCTLKNLQINGAKIDAVAPEIHVRAERFKSSEFSRAVNLIVCNPPYIPDAPPDAGAGADAYQMAVGGLGLCADLLGALESLLLPDGRLLLMTSSISLDEVRRLIPRGFRVVPAMAGDGIRVPLDVNSVLERKDWQEVLVKRTCIERDSQGELWHRILPVWIEREKSPL